jgi:hypothetical protein
MRQCVSSNQKQLWQRTAREYSLPRLMLRPPDVLSFDYLDLCMQVRDDRLGLDIQYCDDDIQLQVLVEAFQMRPIPSPLDDEAKNSRVLTYDHHVTDSSTGVTLEENREEEGQFWFRQGELLRPLHTGGHTLWTKKFIFLPGFILIHPWARWYYTFGFVVQPVREWKLDIPVFNGELKVAPRSGKTVEPVVLLSNEFLQAELRGFYNSAQLVETPHCLNQLGSKNLQFSPCPVAEDGNVAALKYLWSECPDRCTPDVCAGQFNSECVSVGGNATCACLPGWTGDGCVDKFDPCQGVDCGEGSYCHAPDALTSVCTTITPCLVGEYLRLPAGNGRDNQCKKCPPGKVQPIYDIKKVGATVCKSRDEAARVVLDELLQKEESATGRRRLKSTDGMDEQVRV